VDVFMLMLATVLVARVGVVMPAHVLYCQLARIIKAVVWHPQIRKAGQKW